MPLRLKPWQVEYTEYPPYTDVAKDVTGRVLPPMPSKYFIKATLEYGIGSKLNLQKIGRETPTVVTIDEHVYMGYGVCPQVMHGRLESGDEKLTGKRVVVKLYDPLYVSPEYVFTEDSRPVIRSDKETLVVNTPVSKKDIPYFDRESRVLFLSQVLADEDTDPILDRRTTGCYD
jgi:hypothetical protein